MPVSHLKRSYASLLVRKNLTWAAWFSLKMCSKVRLANGTHEVFGSSEFVFVQLGIIGSMTSWWNFFYSIYSCTRQLHRIRHRKEREKRNSQSEWVVGSSFISPHFRSKNVQSPCTATSQKSTRSQVSANLQLNWCQPWPPQPLVIRQYRHFRFIAVASGSQSQWRPVGHSCMHVSLFLSPFLHLSLLFSLRAQNQQLQRQTPFRTETSSAAGVAAQQVRR